MSAAIEAGSNADAAEIEAKLLADLALFQVQSRNEVLVFKILDEQNRLIGGLTASTSYGWLLIKVLWVAESWRCQGLATSLLQVAERAAMDLGCHAAWLDTSNREAKTFYESRGYSLFGKLENKSDQVPVQHKRWFLKKALA